ncbi:hypothetical protein [Nannocystis exedens]|uniref:hypothetical protein n=1 Tax=Nannocystis exedens TaxID=54 RepID=UPI000BB9FF60|nr:hypothetical protein [Nannocystis exedens]
MSPSYQPTLHRLPEDTTGRFAILREFLLRWHGIDTGPVGRTVSRVEEAEARVKRRLPPAVREWIVLLDDLARLGAWVEVLRDALSLTQVPGCRAFSLLVSGENDRHWGPLLRDLGSEDPPTHDFAAVSFGRDREFERVREVAPRVSTWAIEFIVRYLYLSRSVQLEYPVSEAARARLRALGPEVVASQIGRSELFEFEGGLIHVELDSDPSCAMLRCYAPCRATDRSAYDAAADAFARRLDPMWGRA